MPAKKPKPEVPLYELKGSREKLYQMFRKKHPGGDIEEQKKFAQSIDYERIPIYMDCFKEN
jgi:hypothetical protein